MTTETDTHEAPSFLDVFWIPTAWPRVDAPAAPEPARAGEADLDKMEQPMDVAGETDVASSPPLALSTGEKMLRGGLLAAVAIMSMGIAAVVVFFIRWEMKMLAATQLWRQEVKRQAEIAAKNAEAEAPLRAANVDRARPKLAEAETLFARGDYEACHAILTEIRPFAERSDEGILRDWRSLRCRAAREEMDRLVEAVPPDAVTIRVLPSVRLIVPRERITIEKPVAGKFTLRLTNLSRNYVAGIRIKGSITPELTFFTSHPPHIEVPQDSIAIYLPPRSSAKHTLVGFVVFDTFINEIESLTSDLAVESAYGIVPDRGKAERFLELRRLHNEATSEKLPDYYMWAASAYEAYLRQPTSPSQSRLPTSLAPAGIDGEASP